MIELLVVAAIIIVLLSLLLAIGLYARQWAKNRNTTAAMAYLHNASLLYSRSLGGPAADVDAPKYYAVNAATGHKIPLTTMSYFVWRMNSLPDCVAQLQRVPVSMRVPVLDNGSPVALSNIYFLDPTITPAATPALMASNYPLQTINDAWGNELKYCARAAATDSVTTPVFDAAMAYADYPYFASAGKDGKWGALASHDRKQPDNDAKDNIYSMAENQ